MLLSLLFVSPTTGLAHDGTVFYPSGFRCTEGYGSSTKESMKHYDRRPHVVANNALKRDYWRFDFVYVDTPDVAFSVFDVSLSV